MKDALLATQQAVSEKRTALSTLLDNPDASADDLTKAKGELQGAEVRFQAQAALETTTPDYHNHRIP